MRLIASIKKWWETRQLRKNCFHHNHQQGGQSWVRIDHESLTGEQIYVCEHCGSWWVPEVGKPRPCVHHNLMVGASNISVFSESRIETLGIVNNYQKWYRCTCCNKRWVI
jgi:hypothetical protein